MRTLSVTLIDRLQRKPTEHVRPVKVKGFKRAPNLERLYQDFLDDPVKAFVGQLGDGSRVTLVKSKRNGLSASMEATAFGQYRAGKYAVAPTTARLLWRKATAA